MDAYAHVALVMPFRNEARYLPAVLESLEDQHFDHGRLRLIAVDDGSTDEGRALVAAWLARGDIPGEIVSAPGGSIPRALNRGLALVRPDETVVRIDAHAWYAPDYVSSLVAALAALPDEAWCVGGAGRPLPPARFGEALHAALFTNPMGFGPAAYRRRHETPEPVASVYLGAWRPGVLARLNGYDERWRANEDAELAERIRRAGGRVYRVPADARRIVTRGPAATVRQWARYGFWRAQTLKRYPQATRLRHLAPPVAVVGAAALLATPARPALVVLGAAYAAATIALRDRSEPVAVSVACIAFFPVVHAGFALGLLAGLAVRAIPADSLERPDRGP